MAEESDFPFHEFLYDEETVSMNTKGYVKISSSQPPGAFAEAIENAIGWQELYQENASGPTEHFEGEAFSPLSIAAHAFMDYGCNEVFIVQTYLNITEKQKRYEEPRVVRCMGPSKPLMVGPRGYGPGKAVLIIRPFRKKLDRGFIWVYASSEWVADIFSPLLSSRVSSLASSPLAIFGKVANCQVFGSSPMLGVDPGSTVPRDGGVFTVVSYDIQSEELDGSMYTG